MTYPPLPPPRSFVFPFGQIPNLDPNDPRIQAAVQEAGGGAAKKGGDDAEGKKGNNDDKDDSKK